MTIKKKDLKKRVEGEMDTDFKEDLDRLEDDNSHGKKLIDDEKSEWVD